MHLALSILASIIGWREEHTRRCLAKVYLYPTGHTSPLIKSWCKLLKMALRFIFTLKDKRPLGESSSQQSRTLLPPLLSSLSPSPPPPPPPLHHDHHRSPPWRLTTTCCMRPWFLRYLRYATTGPWSRWRTGPTQPWTWMQPGESISIPPPLATLSLDCNDPDSCVFEVEKKDRRFASYAVKKSSQSSLPTGWQVQVDPASGRTFYVNQITGQSQWDSPM